MGHIVTVEIKNGSVYRGKLLDCEDNMNIQISKCMVTQRDGRTMQLEHVYIRGSQIRFLIVPDMLKNAPMFKNIGVAGLSKGPGLGSKNAQFRRQ